MKLSKLEKVGVTTLAIIIITMTAITTSMVSRTNKYVRELWAKVPDNKLEQVMDFNANVSLLKSDDIVVLNATTFEVWISAPAINAETVYLRQSAAGKNKRLLTTWPTDRMLAFMESSVQFIPQNSERYDAVRWNTIIK